MTGLITIESKILSIRGIQVLIDSDLAELYGVETKALNQAVKRNITRFPDDFMFQLTDDEKNKLVTNCDRFEKMKYSSVNPKAFTEHGVLMLANILKSDRAIDASIQVVRTFVKLREYALNYAALAKKLREHDKKLDTIFKVIDALNKPERQTQKQIGFKGEENK